MIGRRILSEIERRTESCIPPKRTAKKRKRPVHRPTASRSVPRQTEDCRASNGSRSPFQHVRLSRSSASPRQASTPMTNSVRDERSVFFDEADGGNGDVIEVSAQRSLAESSLEGSNYQRPLSGSHDNGLRCSTSPNPPYLPIHTRRIEAEELNHRITLSQPSVTGDLDPGDVTRLVQAQPSSGNTMRTSSAYLHHDSLTTRSDRAAVTQYPQLISREDTAMPSHNCHALTENGSRSNVVLNSVSDRLTSNDPCSYPKSSHC
jgi:hypothetical protein